MFEIEWKESAIRDLGKLDKSISSRIFKKIEELKKNFNSLDIKQMQGSDHFRLRVGDYRIIFLIRGTIITISMIGHRKNIYDRV